MAKMKLNTDTSIVDYLKSKGVDSSYNNRKKIATEYGIQGYSGTAEQNIGLLKQLKTGEKTKAQNTTIQNPAKVPDAVSNIPQANIQQPSVQQPQQPVVEPVAQSEVQQLSNPTQAVPQYQSPYSSQIDGILNNILNRQPFDYNPASDPMYQLYSEQYTKNANMGMRDAMGNAAALTGGYGSSYAGTVGQQTYDNQMAELNNVIPDLYNAALSNYQNQLSNDYNSLNALQTMENQAYGQYRDSMGDYQTNRAFDYGRERDAVADSQWQDSFAYGQSRDRVDDKKWRESFEYGKERDSVSDERYQQEFDYGKERDNIADGQWRESFNYGKERDSVADGQWNRSFNYNQSRDAMDDAYRDRTFEYQKSRDAFEDEEAIINELAKEELRNSEKQDKKSTKRVETYSKGAESMFNEKDVLGRPTYSVSDVWNYLDGSDLTDEEFAEIVNGNYALRKYSEGLR